MRPLGHGHVYVIRYFVGPNRPFSYLHLPPLLGSFARPIINCKEKG